LIPALALSPKSPSLQLEQPNEWPKPDSLPAKLVDPDEVGKWFKNVTGTYTSYKRGRVCTYDLHQP
jgi:hypothetical protein